MMPMKQPLNEQDLKNLIDEHLDDCEGYSEVCKLTATPTGKKRIVARIIEIITKDGISSINACLAQIESELIMDI